MLGERSEAKHLLAIKPIPALRLRSGLGASRLGKSCSE